MPKQWFLVALGLIVLVIGYVPLSSSMMQLLLTIIGFFIILLSVLLFSDEASDGKEVIL